MQPAAVTLADVLRARDERVARQADFLRRYGWALISFTMNIPGPVKCDPDIERAFMVGVEQVRALLGKQHYDDHEAKIIVAPTGCEMLWAVDADPTALKRQLMTIEDEHPLGRLFDMDVITPEGKHISRRQERPCLICGQPVRACARSRAHSAEELFAKVKGIIADHFAKVHLLRIGVYATEALLHEVLTTPKPGLVDKLDSGAHDDMDLQTFLRSLEALAPYFEFCAHIGAEGADPLILQQAGLNAERLMYKTVGVNTHKGAIFSMGILCCAAGAVGEGASLDAVLNKAASLGQCYLDQMKQSPPTDTGGGQQYLRYGLTGARGEAAAGFPSVRNISLPVLQAALAEGLSENDAGVRALMSLIAHVQDSNVIRRAGMEGQRWVTGAAHIGTRLHRG